MAIMTLEAIVLGWFAAVGLVELLSDRGPVWADAYLHAWSTRVPREVPTGCHYQLPRANLGYPPGARHLCTDACVTRIPRQAPVGCHYERPPEER